MNSNCNVKTVQPKHKVDLKDFKLPEISVNGLIISETEIAEELQYHQADKLEMVVQMAAQALVIKRLLLDEIKADAKVLETQNEESLIQELLESKLETTIIEADTCLNYFKQNMDKFKTLPLLEVDHILLPAAPDDIGTRDKAKSLAAQIIAQLKSNHSQFAQLAKEYSACPSKAMGGNLGQITKGQTVAEFESQIVRLPIGLAEKPIESRYGFHIVRVSNKIEGRQLEYPMVELKIKQYLQHRQDRLAIQAYIQNLADKADIKGFKLSFAEENIHI
ncbi:MAG: peptidylprolyl isomerase [Enterobacterales bacterium]|nr:peptidylprolyl isomerase [Enterobacterales bacterium]